MGYDALASQRTPTPFSQLMRSSDCSEKVFAFWLNEDPSDPIGGEMTLCGSDPTRYSGDLTYVPVSEKKFWQFTTDSLEINGRSIVSSFEAIADTGTSFFIGPMSDVISIFRALGVPNSGAVNCDRIDDLPVITFTIGGRKFPLTPKQYVFQGQARDGSWICAVSFTSTILYNGPWILGDGKVYCFYVKILRNSFFAFSVHKTILHRI